ncbi:hypothetical protein TrLO_g9662 [Triparma laevis f. longispina]|uniref:Protein kinase domain-containing protein n=1 Tax=Triparma laevis f. longispina TaxID=1714387 RepID=A0A9W7F5S9_9STRA|nr:hypothetical protein TrLO_g9662 [Triparma laevis f. longispina]
MNSKFTSLLNKNKKWASKVLKTGIEGAAALKETEIFHNVPIVHNILAGASLLNGIIDGREEEDDSLNEVKATVQLVSPIVVKIGQATVDLDDDDLNKNLAAMSGILEKIWDDVNDYIESDVFQKITSSGSKKFSSDLHTLRQALDNLSFTITGLSFFAVLRIEGKVDNIALGAYATQKAVEVVNDKLDAQGVTAEYTMKAVDRVDKTTRQTKQSIDRVDETTRQTKQSIKDVHYKLDAQGEATLQAVDRFDEKLGALGEKKTVEQRRDSRGLDLTLVESDLNIEKEPFAHGSFGNIYRAKFEDVVVVAKMISLKDVPPKAHESTKRMFKKEVALMGSLRSNFTAQIFGAVTRPTELILVMEYCEGGDLRGKLDRALAGEETFDHPEAVKMLLNIAHGMKYLHDKTIIHKDLKSLNVLVDEKGRGKVADFGGSFSSSMSSSTSMRSSAGGSGVGTYAWSAPEVLKNGAEALSLKADVFSFAVIIWECTTLQRPWVGKTDSQITIAAATGERPEVDDAMDPDLKGIMEKCWQQDPKARPHFEVIVKWLQDFVKVSASLADHQLDRSLSVSSSTTTTSTASRSVRRTSSFARLSANFSGMGLLQHGRSTSASSTASSKSRSVANPALELWIEIMSEAGVEESSTSHPWNENLVTAIEVHLFDGNDMEAEAAVSLKGALCKKGGDEASLNSWKKFYTKWKKSEHADIIIPYLAELQESSSRTVMGGLKSMVAGSFRKRGSSIAMASPPTVNVNPKDVPKSSETARLEAALLEAKKNKDRAKMKSVKAELSASKENDLKTHTFILEKAKLVKKVADLQKKLDEAWEADEEELIDKYDEMIQSATDSLNNIRKFLAKKFGKRTDADIMAAVKEWFIDSIEAEDKYGHISFWDTSAPPKPEDMNDKLLLTQLAAFKSAPRRNESSVDGINTFNPAEFVRGGMSKFALRNLLPHKDFSTPPPNPVVTEPGAEAQRPTDDLFKQQLERKEYEEKHSNLRLNSSIFAPVHTFFASSTIRSFLKELADDEKLLNIYMGTSEGGVDGNLSNLRQTYHEAGEEEKKTFEPEGWLRPEGFEPLDTSDADKYWDHFNNIHNITLLSEEEIEELTEFAANIVFADLPFMYCSSQEPMYGEYCNECFIPTEETPVLWEELSADTISNDELTAEQEKTITFRASREPFSVQQRRRKIESYFAENYGSNSAETEGYCWDIKDVEEAVTEEAHLKICEENKAREEKALQELADSNLIEFTEEEKAMYKKRAARRGVNPKFALFAKPVVRAVTLEEHLAICFDNVMELFRVLEEREKEGEKVVEFPKMGKWTKKVWKIPKIFLENLERQQNSLMTTSQGGT